MTLRRQHMIPALQLSGKGARPQEAPVRAVRLLSQFDHTSPDLLSEPDLQHSFLPRNNTAHLAPASMRICSRGLRFFSPHVLTRAGHPLALLRAHTAPRLPAVLSVDELRRLLQAATPLHQQVSFTTVSSLGLRLHEALSLQVSAMEGRRLPVHVHRGQGATDRSVPFPQDTLALLRSSWKTPRNPTWLFPATGRDQTQRPRATDPMSHNRGQGAFRKVSG